MKRDGGSAGGAAGAAAAETRAPDGAPQVQRDLYRACKTLAESLVRHIYLENEILFKEIQLKG